MSENKYFSKQVTMVMKGGAVLFMLIHHLFSCFPDFVEKYKVSTSVISLNTLMAFSTFGKICVAVFVFLSAYGMSVSFNHCKKEEQEACVLRRYKKLASSFFFVYLLSILTCFLREDRLSVYAGEGTKKGIFYGILDALGVSHLFGTPTYNETWWYMSVAILLIFLMPVLVKLYENLGISVVVLGAFLTNLGIAPTTFTVYLFPAILGVFMAKSSCIEKIGNMCRKKRIVFCGINAILILMLCYIRIFWGFDTWVDGPIAALSAAEGFVLIDLFGMRFSILAFLGKYSMNIFLIHTLILEYYFTDFIYSFHNWILITIVLTAVSLAASIFIQWTWEKVQKIWFKNF